MTGAEIFHLTAPRKKHEENSNRGDREAVRLGCIGSDHDWCKSADGTVWNNHWPDLFTHDGFMDPKGEFGRGDHIQHIPDEALRRLRAYTNGHRFRLRTADEGLAHAAAVGLKIVYGEAKPRFKWTIADFRARRKTAKAHGIRLVVMTMDSHRGWRRILLKARLAGCRTRRLHMH